MFHGVTLIEFAERINAKHNFNFEITLAGKHRAQVFLIGNTELGVRKPEPTKLAGSWLFKIFFIILSGVRLSPLCTAATTGLLYQPQIDDDDCGAIG
jgi:hypothetical protein